MLLYVLMTCGVVVMFAGLRAYKTKHRLWGRPLAGVAGVFAMTLGLIQIGLISCREEKPNLSLQEQEAAWAQVEMQFLANYLAGTQPGARLLLVINPESFVNKLTRQAQLSGFEGGANGLLEITTGHPAVAPEMQGNPNLLSDPTYFTAESFDQLLSAHADMDIIVSTLGLPADKENMAFWSLPVETRAKLILTSGAIMGLTEALAAGHIAAAVAILPGSSEAQPVPEDFREAFPKRYLLVTTENLEAVRAAHPELLPAP